jgi:hypothetical protein
MTTSPAPNKTAEKAKTKDFYVQRARNAALARWSRLSPRGRRIWHLRRWLKMTDEQREAHAQSMSKMWARKRLERESGK